MTLCLSQIHHHWFLGRLKRNGRVDSLSQQDQAIAALQEKPIQKAVFNAGLQC